MQRVIGPYVFQGKEGRREGGREGGREVGGEGDLGRCCLDNTDRAQVLPVMQRVIGPYVYQGKEGGREGGKEGGRGGKS